MLPCQLSTTVSTVVKAVKHVIKRAKTTGRRSVIAIPLLGSKSKDLNDVVEKATGRNIVVVTAAGK